MTNLSKSIHLVTVNNEQFVDVRFKYLPLYSRISVKDIQLYLEKQHKSIFDFCDASEIMMKIHNGAEANEFCIMVAELKDDWQNLDYSEVQNFIYELQKSHDSILEELIMYRQKFGFIDKDEPILETRRQVYEYLEKKGINQKSNRFHHEAVRLIKENNIKMY